MFSRWIRDMCIDCGVDREAARAFERRLRKEWGGRRVYIAKTMPQDRVDPPTDRSDRARSDSTGEGWYVDTRQLIRQTAAAMPADTDLLPDPRDAAFYVRYVELCRQAGVDPSPPERVRALTSKWNAMLRGEPSPMKEDLQ